MCSYATNEVAINWNAPLAYLAGALEALHHGHVPAFADKSIARDGETASIAPGFGKTMLKAEGVAPRLRFKDQMLYVEKNGIRYNLKGHRLK